MRVAWFRPKSLNSAAALDATPALIRELAGAMTIDVVTQPDAHNFVVEHALRPYDVCVFEPRNQPEGDFIWAYLFQYPGVLLLQDASLHDSRVRALERYRRSADYQAEFRFNHGHPPPSDKAGFNRGSWPMFRTSLFASKLVVVADAERARALETAYPGARVQEVVPFADGPSSVTGSDRGFALEVSIVGEFQRADVRRTVEHAASLGIPVVLTSSTPLRPHFSTSDVVIALDSPAEASNVTPALSAMAWGKAVVVFEREATARWPALDPQTWRSRDRHVVHDPVVVSLDPRDQAHSLVLALKRLAQDQPQRLALGTAARTWWLGHATPAHAAAVWRSVLDEAVALPPPSHPADWPLHLDVDGTERMRALASEMGVGFEAFGLRGPTPSASP